MKEHRQRLLTSKEAAEYLHMSLATLSKIEKERKLIPFRTPGGHRRYSQEMLDEYLEKSRAQFAGMDTSAGMGNVPRQEMRALVVGDELAVEGWVNELQTKHGCSLVLANSGYEVGVQVASFRPHVVILDATQENASEPEFCLRIRSDPQTRHIKFLKITDLEAENDEATEHGADACIARPFRANELYDSLCRLILDGREQYNDFGVDRA